MELADWWQQMVGEFLESGLFEESIWCLRDGAYGVWAMVPMVSGLCCLWCVGYGALECGAKAMVSMLSKLWCLWCLGCGLACLGCVVWALVPWCVELKLWCLGSARRCLWCLV